MKILFVYSDMQCSCTIKCCFELAQAMQVYETVTVIHLNQVAEQLINQYDYIILQRIGANRIIIKEEEKTKLLQLIARTKHSVKWIYMIDDLVLEDQGGLPKVLIAACHGVLCSSDVMKTIIQKINPNVGVFHTFVDLSLIERIPKKTFQKFTVAWLSSGRLGEAVVNYLIEQCHMQRLPIDFICVGGYIKSLKHYPNVDEHTLMPFREMIQLIKGVDVIINPMIAHQSLERQLIKRSNSSITTFLDSKSEIKYAIAGAIEACLVSSPTYNYCKVIQSQYNGVLVEDTPQRWLETIIGLYQDDYATRQMAYRGKEHVARAYTASKAAEHVIRLLAKL